MAYLEDRNVIQLQQELLEKERNLQGAIVIAAQYQARVLSLEDRIDDKNDVKEKVVKKIEKEEQNTRETALQQYNEKLQQDNVDLKRTEARLIRKVEGLGMILREKGAVDYEALNGPPGMQMEQKEEEIDPEDDNPISIRDSQEDEEPIEDDEGSNDDVGTEVDDNVVKVEESIEDTSFKNDESVQMLEPSDLFDGDININEEMADVSELAMAEMDSFDMDDIEHVDGIDQSEFGGNFHVDSMDDMVEREVMENTPDNPKESTVDGDIELRTNRRPSKKASKSVKYTDSLEDSDGDEAPPVKKSRTKDEKKREKKCKAVIQKRNSSNKTCHSESSMNEPKVPKLNKTELKCPECEYRSRSVNGWVTHLIKIHSTTPLLAGLALRCDCGVECLSDYHVRKCEIANVTVIRKSEMMKEPRIAKLNDTELKCPECEYRGRSVKAWIEHLRSIHSTTPTLAGLALRCDCGHEGFSDKHSRTCDATNTTLIVKKMTPPVTPQCVQCEAYPTTLRGYTEHLKRHHQTTLKASGIYLMCICGLKVVSKNCLPKHKKECDGCHFTLHKIYED